MWCLYASSLLYITGNFDSTDPVSNYSECVFERYIDHFYFLHLCLNNTEDIDTYELRLLYLGNNTTRLVIKKIILQPTGKILIFWFDDFVKIYEFFLASSQIQRYSLLLCSFKRAGYFCFIIAFFLFAFYLLLNLIDLSRNALSQKWGKLYILEK